MTYTSLVTRTPLVLRSDPARVIARLFVPGHELESETESRATGVLGRLLALTDEQVSTALSHVLAAYGDRHRDLPGTLAAHYELLAHRVPAGVTLDAERRALVGAVFTSEFSLEGAALFNPSIVEHPDQSGLQPGELRFVLSLRAVGEGHISSVEFRTGVLGPDRTVQVDAPGRHAETGVRQSTLHDRHLFAARLAEEGGDAESSRYVLGRLPERFSDNDLDLSLRALGGQQLTRAGGAHTADLARALALCSYEVVFDPATSLAQRALWPQSSVESHGLEDARFVRFTGDTGAVSYLATYTAFDGARISPQIIATEDFRRFRMSQLAGPAAVNKGMALFPRKVGGRFLALSRWDRESTGLTSSKDGHWWGSAKTLHTPRYAWELIQGGNCGSPVETEAGWLVLTHGVGPMREYVLSAMLLDLEDPATVIGCLDQPLMLAEGEEREGYVPNVVYSCGAIRHGDDLLLPYGVSDAAVRFAFVDLPGLLKALSDQA